MGLACTLLGLGVGLLLFSGQRPTLYGGLSVGSVAAVAGGVAAAGGSAWGYKFLLLRREPWLLSLQVWRWSLVLFSLILVNAAIAVMGLGVIFHLMQQSFLGLRLEPIAASVLTGMAAGVSAYVALETTARTTARMLSVVLGGFMVSGTMISMLVAEDPVWWHTMFSALGTLDSGVLSFWTFNTTLFTSGLVLATFSEFLLRDLVRLARAHDRRARVRGRRPSRVFRPRPKVVQGCLLVVAGGIMLAALVPVNTLGDLHASGVWLSAGALVVMLGGSVFLFPGFPAVFHLLSLATLGGMWLAMLLWLEWEYFNLTGFELVAVAILFGWISAFIRTASAMLQVIEQRLAAEEGTATARGRTE